jgi:hypothetical protein
VIFFVHSTGILRRIGTKHEISVRKSREIPLEKNLSIVVSFVVITKIQLNAILSLRNSVTGGIIGMQGVRQLWTYWTRSYDPPCMHPVKEPTFNCI